MGGQVWLRTDGYGKLVFSIRSGAQSERGHSVRLPAKKSRRKSWPFLICGRPLSLPPEHVLFGDVPVRPEARNGTRHLSYTKPRDYYSDDMSSALLMDGGHSPFRHGVVYVLTCTCWQGSELLPNRLIRRFSIWVCLGQPGAIQPPFVI